MVRTSLTVCLFVCSLALAGEAPVAFEHWNAPHRTPHVVDLLGKASAAPLCKLNSSDYHPASKTEWEEQEQAWPFSDNFFDSKDNFITTQETASYEPASDEDRRIGGYKIIRESEPLSTDQLAPLLSLLADTHSHGEIEHMCGFVPGYGIRVAIDGHKVELLLSLCCDDWWSRIDDRFIHYTSFTNRSGEVFDWVKQYYPKANKRPTSLE